MTPSAQESGAADSAAGRTIHGRYRALAEIGRGAMGRVYRVHDATTGRTLALKSLHVPAGSGLRRQRAELWFRREFHVVAGLRHPCILLVHDYGIDRGVPYYTMELLDGQDLRDLGEVDLEDGVRILRDVASGLAFLHARRLVHRDVKPRNVRCTSAGRAKLIDFGILAAMGTLGDVAGTPTSLPPEALRGLPLDGRADLYALGTLAYWMFTGRYPYIAESVDRLEQAWRIAPPPLRELRPSLPAGLEELVMALVSIDADRRPGSAAEVIDRLDAISGTPPPAEVDIAQGWLRSAALVGRDRELAALREVLERATAGKGGAALIEAASGQGKSRLLREVAWHAQTAGMLVLRAQGDAQTGEPYAVVRSIARQFATVDPAEAERIGAAHESLLGRILPPDGGSSDSWPWAPNEGDPAEHRLRQQRELHAYLLDVARARPTAILVDDLHLCDEASAATLAALAHASCKHRLAVIGAVRTDAPAIGRDAIATFAEAATRLELTGLDAIGVRLLVDAVFGELDVLGLKRAVDDLERRVGDVPGLEPWLQLARGEYARARRDAPAAIAIFRVLLARLSPDELMLLGTTTAGLADALIDDAQYDEAIAVTQRWVEVTTRERSRSLAIRIECARGRALAATGRGGEASAVLLRTLGEAESTGSPLLCGLVHEALAALARVEGDADAERSHADQAALVFATTRNPILLARARPIAAREATGGASERVASEATVQLFDDTMGTGESDHG